MIQYGKCYKNGSCSGAYSCKLEIIFLLEASQLSLDKAILKPGWVYSIYGRMNCFPLGNSVIFRLSFVNTYCAKA